MNLLTLIVLLPLVGFLLNGLAGPRLGKGFATLGRDVLVGTLEGVVAVRTS